MGKTIVTVGKLKESNVIADVAELRASLFSYCISLTGSIPDAEDLVQQTWLKALQSRKIDSHANPEAFLIRIAKNSWVDECRRRRMLRDRIEKLREAEGQPHGEDMTELDRAIAAIYRLMSPLQRTVFLLRDTLGYSIAETADMLDTTDGAVKAALHRARHALEGVREALLQDCGPEDETAVAIDVPEEEAILRQVREAYIQCRTDQLIHLLYLQHVPEKSVAVIGWSMPSPSLGFISSAPQASYSMLVSA